MRCVKLPVCVAFAFNLAFYAANAADLPLKAEPLTAAYDWSGCYLGGYVGGAWQSRDANIWDPVSTGGVFPAGTFYHPNANNSIRGNFNPNLGTNAPISGGTLGCNWQTSSRLLFGVEVEGGYLNIGASVRDPYGFDTISRTKIGDWNASVSGRFGYAWDRTLFYLKGGIGSADVKSSLIDSCATAPCTPSLLAAFGSSQQPFWVGGVGIEYALSDKWSIKGEAMTLGIYKKLSVCGPGAGAASGSTFCGLATVEGVHTFKIGINYKIMPILPGR